MRDTEFAVFKQRGRERRRGRGHLRAGRRRVLSREIDALTEMVKTLGASGLVSIAFGADPRADRRRRRASPVLKFLGLDMARAIGMLAGANAATSC